MYDISPNTQWGVVYELGDFWNLNPDLQGACVDSLNDTWWVDTEEEGGVSGVSSKSKSFTIDVIESHIVEGFDGVVALGMEHYIVSSGILISISVAIIGLCAMVRCARRRYKRMDIMDMF